MATERERLPEAYTPSVAEITGSILSLNRTNPQFPRSLYLEPWRNMVQQVGTQADLMRLPISVPGFRQSYLVTSRSLARQVLMRDFEDVTMPTGEKRFLIATQGGVIQDNENLQEWKVARTELSPSVSPRNLKKHEEIVGEAVGSATESLTEELIKEDVPSSRLFRRFAARAILGTYLGQQLPVEEADQIIDSFNSYYVTSPLLVLKTGRIGPVRRYAEKRLTPYTDTLDHVLTRAVNQGTEGVLTQVLRTQAQDQVMETFRGTITGQGELATSLEWITYNLAKDKETQAGLRESLGTDDFPVLCRQFLESSAETHPTSTFILRRTTAPLEISTGVMPVGSLLAVPLFTLPDQEDATTSQKGTYDLQFSPGLRRCFGKHLTQAIHREYVPAVLASTEDISCANDPKPKLKFTLVRPDQEFDFQFK